MKVDKKKLTEALAYRKLINDTPFEELDWSEYPKAKDVTAEEKDRFQSTGLNNVDFLYNYLT